jgi:putative transcriptional regulator
VTEPGHDAWVVPGRPPWATSTTNATCTRVDGGFSVTVVNLSVLKNGRARAIRFSTLTALCEVLERRPGDLFAYE